MEDCKITRQVAKLNPQGKRRRGRPVNTWKNGIKDRMQRRNLKDEESFGRELWRKKIMSLGSGELRTQSDNVIFCEDGFDHHLDNRVSFFAKPHPSRLNERIPWGCFSGA
jgi:hypothetical protein